MPQLKKIDNCILSLSEALSIPCVIDNNFHYVSPEEKDAYDIATCIRDGKQYYEHGRKKSDALGHIMNEKEIISIASKNGYADEQVH